MPKLYFRYGTVGSAKTMNLLAVAHNYQTQGKVCLTAKPAMDTRFGRGIIRSRAGLEKAAHILIEKGEPMDEDLFKGKKVDCLLVDEAQFLSSHQIDQLRQVTYRYNVPVICYGLRTDFRSHLFEGSKRLMEVADAVKKFPLQSIEKFVDFALQVEEIKTTCSYCNAKAIFNLKLMDGTPTLLGPQVQLGCEETYVPSCFRHFHEKTRTLGHQITPRKAAKPLSEGKKKESIQTSTPLAETVSKIQSSELNTPIASLSNSKIVSDITKRPRDVRGKLAILEKENVQSPELSSPTNAKKFKIADMSMSLHMFKTAMEPTPRN